MTPPVDPHLKVVRALTVSTLSALLVGEGTEQLDPSQAAKIFEGQLASALVAEDGQLALSNLAQSAAHAVMPKLQTQGQLGQARSSPPADHVGI